MHFASSPSVCDSKYWSFSWIYMPTWAARPITETWQTPISSSMEQRSNLGLGIPWLDSIYPWNTSTFILHPQQPSSTQRIYIRYGKFINTVYSPNNIRMPGFNALQSKPPAPPTALGRLRLLSPNAAIRCSPLLFGGISLGKLAFSGLKACWWEVLRGTSISHRPTKRSRSSYWMPSSLPVGISSIQPMATVWAFRVSGKRAADE